MPCCGDGICLSVFQSLVLVSRLPYVNLFQSLLQLIAPEYFDKLEPCLEAGEKLGAWPSHCLVLEGRAVQPGSRIAPLVCLSHAKVDMYSFQVWRRGEHSHDRSFGCLYSMRQGSLLRTAVLLKSHPRGIKT